jgi:hypothetical protein
VRTNIQGKPYPPIQTPGHVFCVTCLTNDICVNGGAIEAGCPTCRTIFRTGKLSQIHSQFPIDSLHVLVLPNPLYVPEKFNPFILSPIRPLSLDPSLQNLHTELRTQIARLQAQINMLEADKAQLTEECENHKAESKRHAELERKAKANFEKEKRKKTELLTKYIAMEAYNRSLLDR